MKARLRYTLVIVMLVLFFLMGPVSAAITTIPAGGSVFIGEQGLDVTLAMDGDTQIGWWASAASIADSAPTYIVSVSNPENFSISPNTFRSQTGVWYRLNPSGTANGTAFNVLDPQLALKIEDTTVNVDVTDKWVPTDDEIRFRIDTNLVSIAQRSGVSSVPITIKVRDPNGGTFTSLINKAGTATSIEGIPVTTTPFYTQSIWDTGKRSIYSTGTYSIWAECNVNSMKDNYEQSGKTVSQKASLQNQDHNPLITGNYPATAVTQTMTRSATTVKTPVPITSAPTVVVTPATTITTPEPVSPTGTLPSATAAQTPSPTKTPGFEGIAAGIALLGALLVCCRKS